MKRLIVFLIAITILPIGAAESSRKKRTQTTSRVAVGERDLADALVLAKSGKYAEASQKLFTLSYSPRFREKRMQIKYILGMTLHQLKLNQVAAFQFIGVVKEGNNKYIKQSLEKLSLAADSLGDDTLLNYAISRVNVDEFPRVHRDMLHFRIGEYMMRNKQFEQAARSFDRVARGHSLYNNSKYQQGLAYAESGQLDRALTTFEELIQSRGGRITDKAKVAGMMGKARVLYQRKNWDEALEVYRSIPRDSEFWHDTLFEASWAMLRSGRFRSAISNFQSLHSAFYEDHYLPESLLLRSIVYLYICKYDEMDKVLNLFSKIYKPVYKQIDQTLENVDKPERYFNMMNDMMRTMKHGKTDDKMTTPLPYLVAQKITREADFQGVFQYIRRLMEEKKRIQQIPGGWASSSVGLYAKKVLNTRIVKAKQKAGKIVRNHLLNIKEELIDLIEQEGFARYEMINGRKESLKKKIAGKELEDQQIDQANQRDFYIQNGYEYWPFKSEYWLDELGNYHYVGTQSCN
jgi:tetratricopeptide (TPR) repeat protein